MYVDADHAVVGIGFQRLAHLGEPLAVGLAVEVALEPTGDDERLALVPSAAGRDERGG